MAAFLDVCRFIPTAGGTTDWTYSSAVQGYQSPSSAGAVNGSLYRYRAESSDLSQWEVGYGTYSTSTGVLTRATVLFNSLGTTAKVNFSTTPQVAIVALAEDLVQLQNFGVSNSSLAVSASAGALTIALKDNAGNDPSASSPVSAYFRNVTQATGSWTQLAITAANSITLTSGSTLGVASSTAFRLWVVLFNDAGTPRLGVVNCSTATQIFPLNDGVITSATLISAGATSAGVIYAPAGVTSKAFLVLVYLELSSAGITAGTWTTTNLASVQSYGHGIPLPGTLVQRLVNQNGTVQSGTTVFTFNNSTPTNSQGDQYFAQAITPTSAANIIEIEAILYVNSSINATMGMAIYQDSTVNALASGLTNTPNAANCAVMRYAFVANTTSSTTLKLRAGVSAAGTMYLNSSAAGSGYFNGTLTSQFFVREIQG